MATAALARSVRAQRIWWLSAAIAAGILARIAVAISHGNFASGDQLDYSQLAAALADHLKYRLLLGSDPFHWAPGAPLVFAAGLRVFGRGDSGLAGAYTAQALISIAGVGAAYLIARRLLSARAALWCAAGVALSPGVVKAGGDLITEPLGGLLLVLAAGILCIVVTSPQQAGRRLLLLAAGAILGAGVLTRPDYLVLVPTLLVALLIAWRIPLAQRLQGTALVLASCALIVAPYSVWASHQAGAFVLPTTSGPSSFFVGTYLPADGLTYRARGLLAPEVHQLFPDTQLQSHPAGTDMMRAVAARRPQLSRNAAIFAAVRANVRDYALGHPFAFTRMELRKLGRMWERPYAGHNRARAWWSEILHLPTVIAAILTVAAGLYLRRRSPALVLLASVLVIGTLFNGLAAVQPRANTRFVAVAMVGAAVAISELRAHRARAR